MTKFESTIQQIESGTLQPPKVIMQHGEVNYIWYQINVHLYYLKIMASGLKVRNVRLKDIREYYGIKGRTAKELSDALFCLQQQYLSTQLFTEKTK